MRDNQVDKERIPANYQQNLSDALVTAIKQYANTVKRESPQNQTHIENVSFGSQIVYGVNVPTVIGTSVCGSSVEVEVGTIGLNQPDSKYGRVYLSLRPYGDFSKDQGEREESYIQPDGEVEIKLAGMGDWEMLTLKDALAFASDVLEAQIATDGNLQESLEWKTPKEKGGSYGRY